MKKFKFSSLLFLFAFALVSMAITSCGDEDPMEEVVDIVGCMDATADNYDETATVSDSTVTCVYQSCFEGQYDGTFGCQVLPFTSAELSITANPTNDQQLNLIVVSTTLATPIPLTADVVDCSKMTVVSNLMGIDLSGIQAILDQFGPDARWDIDISGDLTRIADNSLDGSISFTLTEVGLGSGVVLPDNCTFNAVPK